jgi:hypothetical protein
LLFRKRPFSWRSKKLEAGNILVRAGESIYLGGAQMETWQAFLLGMMAAYTPSLVAFALLLHRRSFFGWPSQ